MPSTIDIEKLDEHLLQVVQTLHAAVRQGIPNVNDPRIVDRTIRDRRELLQEVLAGRVSEWLR